MPIDRHVNCSGQTSGKWISTNEPNVERRWFAEEVREMSCCFGWMLPETMFLLDELPCGNCLQQDKRSLHLPDPLPDGPVVRFGTVSKSLGPTKVLDDVTFEVQRGEVLAIIGDSSAGTPALTRCLAGLEKPDRGRIEIAGQSIIPLGESELRQVRRRIGVIYQNFNLLSSKTVEQNVGLPLKIAGVSRSQSAARVRELLALVSLLDKARVYPAELSSGPKQLVGIARALAANPALLLCDEATSALDPEATMVILDLLREINRRLGLTIVLITSEMSVVRAIADRVIVMDQGRIVEEGEVHRVLVAPEAELTQRLIGVQISELPGALRNGVRHDWAAGTHLVLRIHLSGDATERPVLAEMTRDLDVLPVVLDAAVQHVREHIVASFVVGFKDAGEPLARRIGEYLLTRGSRLEVLGYVKQLA
jgi:D-methionine transport system ATP-binding protein